FCEEIVVVDCGSRDGTRRIAEAAGARVIVHEPWPGFVAQRNFAAQSARHDWLLAVDADERVSPGLRQEIQGRRAAGFTHAGYRIPRVARYLGRWIRGTDWYPDPQLRLWDRRRGRWEGALIHESVRVLHVDSARGWRGGQNQVLLTARGMAARGHDVTLVCQSRGALAGRARAAGLDVRETPFGGDLAPGAVVALRAALREIRPEVVQLHDPHAVAAGLLACRLAGRPPAVATRRVDFALRGALSRW